jgi:hypothetical protein
VQTPSVPVALSSLPTPGRQQTKCISLTFLSPKRRRPGSLIEPMKPLLLHATQPVEACNWNLQLILLLGHRGQGTFRPSIHGTSRPPIAKRKGKGQAAGVCCHHRRAGGLSGKVTTEDEASSRSIARERFQGTGGWHEETSGQGASKETAAEHAETCSTIELWLGFLSMQHGTLLRWDP